MKPLFEMSANARLLRQHLAASHIGDVIDYQALSSVISAPVDSSTGALRTALHSLLRNERMVFSSIRGVGITRLADSDIVADAVSGVDAIRRKARRSVSRLTAVVAFDKLTPANQLAHTTRLSVFTAVASMASDSGLKRLEKVATGRSSELPIAETMRAFLG